MSACDASAAYPCKPLVRGEDQSDDSSALDGPVDCFGITRDRNSAAVWTLCDEEIGVFLQLPPLLVR